MKTNRHGLPVLDDPAKGRERARREAERDAAVEATNARWDEYLSQRQGLKPKYRLWEER